MSSSPTKHANHFIDRLYLGEQLHVFGGPGCAENFTFWNVKRPSSDKNGWVIERDS
jgi:hypothetical protein